ncbi:acyl CoA:acetate/3-ketoacid CoA transferase [Salicibibacter cibarius]|uniref:Acyl CoA:acetate/3-ketoacid CoA transferase n=1 Tax=Salicibibacter cibarius TaxID=2743000 RepID=A0A7T7CD93_9BACI|nr:CoA-transferase [Salicibibacter cibarius]QQK77774.1 acyl CoA:acetate/3-ketoacid CoA transferase [Salicibibacter cibarius]
MAKIVTFEDAIKFVESGQTIIISGAGEVLLPDRLLAELETKYIETGEPKGLNVVYNVIPGAQRKGTGIDRLAHEEMVKRIYAGSYYTLKVEKLNELINKNSIEAYLIPYGALFNMVRTTAAGQPGVLTPVGIDTFVDPRVGGHKLTARTKGEISSVMEIEGKEYIFYKSLEIDVALIRATTADENGNLSIEQEPSSLGLLHQAMAAKNRGGTVIAQVEQIAKRGSMHPKEVAVPSIFVDYIVVDSDQMNAQPYNPAWTGDIKIPVDRAGDTPFDYRKVIVRRAAMELSPGQLVNCGFGLSAEVPLIAMEEGISDDVTFNVEHGPVGGVPNTKSSFGMGVNMMAIMDSHTIFDFYNAGRLDATFLGSAEVNREGSVNVSFINGKYNLGGFIDIVHSTKKIVFCGSFTASGLDIKIEDGKLNIVQDGRHIKFVNALGHMTFNGKQALIKNQKVYYVTERAVFTLTDEGLTLIEIAPGISLENDVLNKMEFRPHVSESLKEMDNRLFIPDPLGLKEHSPWSE